MPHHKDQYYFDHGIPAPEGIPLVLIHGGGGTGLFWPPDLRRIPDHRVLAVDLYGHGKSGGSGERSIGAYAGHVLGLIDALGLEKAVIGGHSMGSAIALWLALEHPERVGGLILFGTGARLRVHPEILAKCASDATYREAVSLVTAHSFGPGAPPRLLELAEQRMSETPREVLYGDFLACDSFDVMDRVEEIEQPALVICGEKDRMTPPPYSQYLVEKMGDAQLEVVPGAGHMVMLEQPGRLRELIGKFLLRYRNLLLNG